jgi:hypothetical protein
VAMFPSKQCLLQFVIEQNLLIEIEPFHSFGFKAFSCSKQFESMT